MAATRGHIVRTPAGSMPYKVVLDHDGGQTEHPVATVREGEALIRREVPAPRRDRSREYTG